jgi:hypothetical protein
MANKFIQGYFSGNFECVNRNGDNPAQLVHYIRGHEESWHASVVISQGAASVDSPGAIIASTIGEPPGRMDILVLEGSNLVHYFGNQDNARDQWQQAEPFIVSTAATAEASFIQSTFKQAPDAPGNFEAVVLEGNNLVHYWKDNSKPTSAWIRTDVITSTATTAGCIIQSTLGGQPGIGNFEVVVVEGTNLVHYYRDNSSKPFRWSPVGPRPTATISTHAVSSASLIQSNFTSASGAPGNFELVVLESDRLDEQKALVHYSRDNSTEPYKWSATPTATISKQGQGPPCIIQSTYGKPPGQGNFEVLLVDGTDGGHSLDHYSRDNTQPTPQPWVKEGVVVTFPINSMNW